MYTIETNSTTQNHQQKKRKRKMMIEIISNKEFFLLKKTRKFMRFFCDKKSSIHIMYFVTFLGNTTIKGDYFGT